MKMQVAGVEIGLMPAFLSRLPRDQCAIDLGAAVELEERMGRVDRQGRSVEFVASEKLA
jgi:hypothetical protein